MNTYDKAKSALRFPDLMSTNAMSRSPVYFDPDSVYTDPAVAYLGFHFRGGGGFKIFLEKWGYLHGALRHAARGEATRLLGELRHAPPRQFLKNGAIWCVLENILLKFCKIKM